jgi:hypothetical protein
MPDTPPDHFAEVEPSRFNRNCTVVSVLLNLRREHWGNYRRDFSDYLNWLKNTLSLKCNLVMHIDLAHHELATNERRKHDPLMHHTILVKTELRDLPMHGYRTRIAETMLREDFRSGLALPDVPEASNPDYATLILSKVPLVRRWCDRDPFGTPYFCWLDAGMCHSSFPARLYGTTFPQDEKISAICVNDKIHVLCRSTPQATDANISWFFKAHVNRFGAACVFGRRERFAELEAKQTELLERALGMSLIDCEQSLWTVIHLENPGLIEPFMGDWYDNFFRIADARR